MKITYQPDGFAPFCTYFGLKVNVLAYEYLTLSMWPAETKELSTPDLSRYSVFQGFSKAKSANGGSILSSSQFLILPQLPQKIKLASKVVKVDSKIIIFLPKI
jgi:hypothetical protein